MRDAPFLPKEATKLLIDLSLRSLKSDYFDSITHNASGEKCARAREVGDKRIEFKDQEHIQGDHIVERDMILRNDIIIQNAFYSGNSTR